MPDRWQRGGREGSFPGGWADVLIVVPCLLTLPAAGYGMLLGLYLSWSACFDSCGNNTGWFDSPAGAGTVLIAELVLGITALVILVAALAGPGWRRVLGLADWVVFLLACAGVGLLAWSP